MEVPVFMKELAKAFEPILQRMQRQVTIVQEDGTEYFAEWANLGYLNNEESDERCLMVNVAGEWLIATCIATTIFAPEPGIYLHDRAEYVAKVITPQSLVKILLMRTQEELEELRKRTLAVQESNTKLKFLAEHLDRVGLQTPHNTTA